MPKGILLIGREHNLEERLNEDYVVYSDPEGISGLTIAESIKPNAVGFTIIDNPTCTTYFEIIEKMRSRARFQNMPVGVVLSAEESNKSFSGDNVYALPEEVKGISKIVEENYREC